MSSIRVKLKETEDMDPGIARRCEVKVKGMDTFHTPSRGVITSEVNKFIKNTTKRVSNLTLENPILEIVHDFKGELSRLHKMNGFFGKVQTRIDSFSNKFGGDMFLLFYPRWNKDSPPSDKDLQYLIELQLLSELKYITLPEKSRGMAFDDFKNHVLRFQKKMVNETVTSTEKLLIPRLSIQDSEANFKKKVDFLFDSDSEFPICLIEYGSYSNFIPNYDYLISKTPENTLLHMFSTAKRKRRGYENAYSIPHWLQTKGIDSFTVFQHHPFESKKPQTIKDIPFLREADLRFVKWGAVSDKAQKCGCLYCSGNAIGKVASIDGVVTRGKNKGNQSYPKTQNALTLHEVYLGTKEFETSEKRIKENDLKEYLQEKKLTDNDIGT
jgi:hypothetical protein